MIETLYHPRYKRTPDHEQYDGWDDFRARCHPGRYYPASWRYAEGFNNDVNELRLLLIAAHLRLDRIDALDGLPHRQPPRIEAA